MKILDRYILRTVLWTLLLVLLMLSGLDTLFSFIAELEDLADNYRLVDAAIYSVATFPRRFYEFIPVATLIGCLLALGMLASSSELVVMRAAGVSIYRIVYSVLKAVLVIVCVGLLLGQFVMPVTEQFAQSHRALQQGGGKTLRVKHGNWHRDGRFFIHINAIEPNGVMHGVTRYEVGPDNRLRKTAFSQRADYRDLGEEQQGGYWLLQDNHVTTLSDRRMEVDKPRLSQWQTSLDPEMLNLVVLKPDHLSITGLWQYAHHLQNEGLSYRPYLLAFWKKVMQPFGTVTMILLAASFIFGPLRSVTMGQRVMVGLIVGLLFNYAQDFLGFASLVFGVPSWLAATVPVLVFAVIGTVLLARVR